MIPPCTRLRVLTKPARQLGRRHLHATGTLQANPFFALASLSNARETQHLTKISKLPRVEHSPSLKLIQASEVDPFDSNQRSIRSAADSTQTGFDKVVRSIVTSSHPSDAAQDVNDLDALSVGRAILAEKDTLIQRLQHALTEEQDRGVKREQSYGIARTRHRDVVDGLKMDVAFAQNFAWMLFVAVGTAGLYLGWQTLFGEESIPHEQEEKEIRAVPSSQAQDPTVVVVLEPTPATKETPALEIVQRRGLGSLFWKRRESRETVP